MKTFLSQRRDLIRNKNEISAFGIIVNESFLSKHLKKRKKRFFYYDFYVFRDHQQI